VDTSVKTRRRWAIEIKRRIVEESLEGKASVAELGQKYEVNANQVFQWRKQYREGRLGDNGSARLLPVRVSKEIVAQAASLASPSGKSSAGTLKIELPKGKLRIAGSVDVEVLRAVLECLLA
jgi:transposase